MSMIPKSSVVITGIPIWQTVHALETVQGGLTLDRTGLTTGAILAGGSPVSYDEATRLARVVLMANMYEAAVGTPTLYRVKKGTNLQVGQNVAYTPGGPAYAITAINTTNAAYDELTLATSIGAVPVTGALFVSSANGAAAATYGITGKSGLLYQDYEVDDDVTVSVVIVGTVYARRIPAMQQALKDSFKRITFSDSY
jgi:hypothetical protein